MKDCYGIFYYYKGKWKGPYLGELWDNYNEAYKNMMDYKNNTLFFGGSQLKNKCEVRKQMWVKINKI
jgi:hypothetical protein